MVVQVTATEIERYRAARERVDLTSSWRIQQHAGVWCVVVYEGGTPAFWVALGLEDTAQQIREVGETEDTVRYVLRRHMDNIHSTLWSLAAGER